MLPDGWRLCLLGVARVTHADGRVLQLERKAAGILTFLVLEGAAPRSRFAGYMWPESREHTARNNLTQLLRKLRLASGEELIVNSGAGDVRVSDVVTSDAADAREQYLLGRYESFLSYAGTLLGNFDFDDCPEFADWLLAERVRWSEWRRHALQELSVEAERQADFGSALRWAELRLEEDPTAEAAFVQVMRLQYLRGNRDKALIAFARCRQVLRHEFGVEPLASTLELARTIQQSAAPPGRVRSSRPQIPLSVLRPPVLTGREAVWEQMEDAWERGQGIVLCGEPGVGKSRLMLEFAASKGPAIHLDGRPGDRTVPYGTYTRGWRALLAGRTDLVIPDWVRREFSRLVPDLWPGEPPPLTSPTDKARFLEATAEMARLISQGVVVALCDDMHYYDPASMELGAYIGSQLVPFDAAKGAAHNICALRRGEMDPAAEAQLRAMTDAGVGVWIDLEPLDAQHVTSVLVSLNLPDVARHTAQLSKFSGGNPLFLLETVKHLYETGQLAQETLATLPLPEKVHGLIAERLKRLSPTAQRVTQAAAVLQSGFHLDLVAEVLNAPLMDVLAAWQELERAQIITGERFSHDLVYESVLRTMTDSVRQALHRSAARTLERQGGNPVRVARHWLEGRDPLRAVPGLREAASQARDAMRLAESAEYTEQALNILLEHGRAGSAFEFLLDIVRDRWWTLGFDEHDSSVMTHLRALAVTPPQQKLARLYERLVGVRQVNVTQALEELTKAETELELIDDRLQRAQAAELVQATRQELRRRPDQTMQH